MNTALPSLLSLAVLCAVVMISTPIMIVYARRARLEDSPGPRSSHQGRIPRGGGAIAIAALVLALLGCWPLAWPTWLIPGALAAIAAIGWLDDHSPQPVRRRLLVQLLAAAVLSTLLLAGPGLQPESGAQFEHILSWLLHEPWHLALLAFALIASVWLINLYNFMDGSHGLAAGEAIFTGAACYWLLGDSDAAALGGMLAAVMLGFLPWNFPRARIFMGDVASGTLGLCVAAMALLAGPHDWWLPLLLSSLFIADTSLTLLDRIRRRQVWYQAHREHRYQRLIQHGWSHTQVWLAYQAINLLFILPLAYWCLQTQLHFAWPLGIATFALTGLWLLLGHWLKQAPPLSAQTPTGTRQATAPNQEQIPS